MDAKVRLKEARARLGLTQVEVAERLGFAQNTVSKHETGAGLSAETLARYAALYGCRMDDLYVTDAHVCQPSDWSAELSAPEVAS